MRKSKSAFLLPSRQWSWKTLTAIAILKSSNEWLKLTQSPRFLWLSLMVFIILWSFLHHFYLLGVDFLVDLVRAFLIVFNLFR